MVKGKFKMRMRWTEEKIQFLIDNYQEKSSKELMEYLGCTESALMWCARKNNLNKIHEDKTKIGSVFGGLKVIGEKFSEPSINGKFIIWKVNCFCSYCGNECTIFVNSLVSCRATSCGCNAKNIKHRLYSFNYQFFDNWSVEMAYVLGFVTADGNSHHNRLKIAIKADDVEILEYIKEKMEFTGPIHSRQRKNPTKGKTEVLHQKSLTLDSYKVMNKIKEYGIIPNKTGKEILPDIPDEYFYDYVRGFFDGDGSVWFKYHKGIRHINTSFSCANKKFLEDLQNRIGGFGSISTTKKQTCHVLHIAHYNSVTLGQKMYSNPDCFALKRKRYRFN